MDANVFAGVKSEAEVLEVLALLFKPTFFENSRFTKNEDILFALEISSKSVCNLLYKTINKNNNAKFSESSS